MPKQHNEERITMTKDELIDLTLKGFNDIKEVKKESNSSGVIRLPVRFIGQKFRVILIPQSNLDEHELNKEMKALKDIQ